MTRQTPVTPGLATNAICTGHGEPRCSLLVLSFPAAGEGIYDMQVVPTRATCQPMTHCQTANTGALHHHLWSCATLWLGPSTETRRSLERGSPRPPPRATEATSWYSFVCEWPPLLKCPPLYSTRTPLQSTPTRPEALIKPPYWAKLAATNTRKHRSGRCAVFNADAP